MHHVQWGEVNARNLLTNFFYSPLILLDGLLTLGAQIIGSTLRSMTSGNTAEARTPLDCVGTRTGAATISLLTTTRGIILLSCRVEESTESSRSSLMEWRVTTAKTSVLNMILTRTMEPFGSTAGETRQSGTLAQDQFLEVCHIILFLRTVHSQARLTRF